MSKRALLLFGLAPEKVRLSDAIREILFDLLQSRSRVVTEPCAQPGNWLVALDPSTTKNVESIARA